MSEVLVTVEQEPDGGFCARAIGHSIFTQADSWSELIDNVREAVTLHFEGSLDVPQTIRVRLERETVVPATYPESRNKS
jgi:predicted RNase H-like HicB family nuclease